MNSPNIKQLSIQVNLNGLSFCIHNKTTSTIDLLYSVNFEGKLNPEQLLDRLKAKLSVHTAFLDHFESVQIIHQNELATFVPKILFDESCKSDYLKFNAKMLKTDFLATDHLAYTDVVTVYVPYININNYIFETFGEFTYRHATSVFLDAILQASKSNDVSKVFVNVSSHSFELAVLKDGTLQLFNIFEYQNATDFIYYILFVYEQLQLNTNDVSIVVSGQIDEGDDLFNILYSYIKDIEFAEITNSFDLSDELKEIVPRHHYLILNSF